MKPVNREIHPGNTYCITIQGQASGGSFQDRFCRRYYLIRFLSAARTFRVAVHAYVVLENCAHFLLTPTTSNSINHLVISTNRSYGEYFGTRFNRDKSALKPAIVMSEIAGRQLFLDTQKFLERRCVDLGLCDNAGVYEWSSFTTNAFGCRSESIRKHPEFRRFLEENDGRLSRYRDFVSAAFDVKYRNYLQAMLELGKPVAKRAARRRPIIAVRRKSFSGVLESQLITL